MSFLLFARNFTEPEVIANADVSSEDADYPVENVYNVERRRKTWRTNGHFKIESGSNTLVFRESVGVNLTATVTAAAYASDSLFFAALKTALEAAGDSTYTVTRDATSDRIKITSNGSGGGGIFQLMLTNGSSAAMAAVLGYSTATDRTGALNYEADLVRLHTSEFLLWDLGIPSTPTGFLGVMDRNASLSFSGTATIKLQGNQTNDFTAPTFEQDVEILDNLIFLLDEDGFNSATPLRYWRLYFEDKDNVNAYLELGTVWLGEHLELTRGCPVFPLTVGELDLSEIVYSENGRTVVSRKPKAQTYQIDWAGLDKPSFEKLINFWNYYGVHTSFFVAMDKEEAFSTDQGKWCKLVKFTSASASSLVSPGNWSMTWDLREQL